MRNVEIHLPGIKTILDGTVENYPHGFVMGYEALIREFWKDNYPEVLSRQGETYRVTFPGHGVLEMKGREYTFRPSAEYAKTKDYPAEISGVWG